MGARFALARQQGLTEELVAELPNFESSRKLTGQEKAVVRFAEILAGDHRQASQQTFDVLREHFTESEIIDLGFRIVRSEEHTSELQSPDHLVCRLLLEKKKKNSKSVIEVLEQMRT